MRYFLIGFMGAGKTTIGRDLARLLGVAFHDVDELIRQKTGMRIEDIFARHGEGFFRSIETEILRQLARQGPGVVATGGGTFVRSENREIIRSSGISIWLDAPTESLLKRGGLGEHRPLWSGPEQARTLLEKRLPYYRLADIRFDLRTTSPEEAAQQLSSMLKSGSLATFGDEHAPLVEDASDR